MDPPRTKSSKGKKKKAVKKKASRANDYHDLHYDEIDGGRRPRSPGYFDSEVESSFDELNLSDAECPAINDHQEDSDDDDAVVKRLYKGPRKCRCCTNWVKNPPQPISGPKRNETSSKHAVTARYSSKRKDMQLTTSIHSITVHSQHLKDVLSNLLDEYPGINIGRGDASFYPPFQPIVRVWKDLKSSVSELEGEARERVDSFCEIVEPEIGETLKDRDDLLSRGLMTYELLWTLYKPGDRVFCKIGGTRHLMQITGSREELDLFTLNLTYWDLSSKFPFNKTWSEIVFPFSGTKPVEELDAIPYDLFPNADSACNELKLRGRKIRDIPQGGLKWFEGFVTVPVQGFGITRKRWVEGRVIIDPQEYDKMTADPFMLGLQPPPAPSAVEAVSPVVDGEDGVSQDQLAQSRSVVRGFSLATKSWHEFEVDGITDIEWNDHVSSHREPRFQTPVYGADADSSANQAFDQLVMHSSRKRLIKALVDSNQGRNTGFDDFIKGKGQGLIMLLSGRPGTGKTLTAESIAERIHLPLYSVHSSELSAADGGDIESKLSDILHRAAHWNAVLLIDEADAFLETRNNWDIARNQRVAVFLRLLEFYSGVLILTTNRRISFDPAFYSRIHLTLKFEDLDIGARSSIWKNFLRSMPNNVHESDVSALAQANFNGRQIKNVIKMASLLSHSERETLCTEHLQTMLEAVDEIGEDERCESEDDERSQLSG